MLIKEENIHIEAYCFWSALSTSLSELSTTSGCSLSRKKVDNGIQVYITFSKNQKQFNKKEIFADKSIYQPCPLCDIAKSNRNAWSELHVIIGETGGLV